MHQLESDLLREVSYRMDSLLFDSWEYQGLRFDNLSAEKSCLPFELLRCPVLFGHLHQFVVNDSRQQLAVSKCDQLPNNQWTTLEQHQWNKEANLRSERRLLCGLLLFQKSERLVRLALLVHLQSIHVKLILLREHVHKTYWGKRFGQRSALLSLCLL